MGTQRQSLRRRIGIAAGLAALGAALLAPSVDARSKSSKPQRAAIDVTGWSRAAAPALPTPDAGDGIGPGSYLLISRTDGTFICTANFLWKGGKTTYLGAAGHCFLPPDAVVANRSNPYVQRVEVCVAGCAFGGQLGAVIVGDFRTLGAVRYARQTDGKGDDVGHDFGIVAVPSGLSSLLRRNVPVWGGPAGVTAMKPGTQTCVYGNAAGLGEVFATKARAGVGLFEDAGAWFAALPAFQGDSGAAVVACDSTAALGVLTHLTATGVAGTTVARAQQMVRSETGITLTLA